MKTAIPHQLYIALCRLGRQIHRMEHLLAERDARGGQKLYRGQTHLLSLISRKNGASQRDLAEEMDVRPSSMTEMLLRAKAAGFITRKQDENDQRITRIFLTKAGEDAFAQSNEAVPDLAATLFNCLTAEEQAQMLALIEKCSAGLEIMDRPCRPGEHLNGFHRGRHWHHGRHRAHPFSFAAKNPEPDDEF
jgi:DNA-binding MarR family transcriptional regulator